MPWNDPARRRSIRMPWHDYSSGRYFLTMVAHERVPLFGDIVGTYVRASDVGSMCEYWWNKLPERYPNASLEDFVFMPDHMHAILELHAPRSATTVEADPRVRPGIAALTPLSQIVRWFKTMTTNEYMRRVHSDGWDPFAGRLWQRNYHERLLRNDADVDAAKHYIRLNPARWTLDRAEPSSNLRSP